MEEFPHVGPSLRLVWAPHPGASAARVDPRGQGDSEVLVLLSRSASRPGGSEPAAGQPRMRQAASPGLARGGH